MSSKSRTWLYIAVIAAVVAVAIVAAIVLWPEDNAVAVLPTMQPTVTADVTVNPEPDRALAALAVVKAMRRPVTLPIGESPGAESPGVESPGVESPAERVTVWVNRDDPDRALAMNFDTGTVTMSRISTGESFTVEDWQGGVTDDGIEYIVHPWTEDELVAIGSPEGTTSGVWVFFVNPDDYSLYEVCQVYDANEEVLGGWESYWDLQQ